MHISETKRESDERFYQGILHNRNHIAIKCTPYKLKCKIFKEYGNIIKAKEHQNIAPGVHLQTTKDCYYLAFNRWTCTLYELIDFCAKITNINNSASQFPWTSYFKETSFYSLTQVGFSFFLSCSSFVFAFFFLGILTWRGWQLEVAINIDY